MRESKYQAQLIEELYSIFRGCVILKNDPNYRQGMPDIMILFGNRWAVLEVKASQNTPSQPNQEYYIELLNEMSFAAFIYPENHEEVLIQLFEALAGVR